jgi:hypothetical protein
VESRRFDALTRALSAPGSRRHALISLLGSALGLLAVGAGASDEADAKGRRKRRKKRHKHGKGNGRHRKGQRRQSCRKESRARICAGKCGIVKNKKSCRKKVDCGACCTGPLPTEDLQAAIDATPPAGTLTLCAGAWLLEETVSITRDLTLRGAGADLTILDGQGQVRVLQIGADAEVALHDLTVTGGRVDAGEDGGGIANAGTLTLRGVAVTGNTSADEGGGINNTGTLTLQAGSRVAGNTATDAGGGIHNDGTLAMENDSLVGGDSPADANTADFGGGIASAGTLTLQAGSRVSGNTASSLGGGIANIGGGTVILQADSRVVGNAAFEGGGIFNQPEATVTVQDGALVCDNEPSDSQCLALIGTIDNCPNPTDGVCPA